MRAIAGFSLVELMISLVAGMIVVGAVLTFTVSSVRSNSEYIKATRLTQELRNSLDFMTEELKRAGYDENAMAYVSNPSSLAVSKFAPILIDTTAGANCIIYAYDREPGTAGDIDLDNGEIRGMRRATTPSGVGVIEVAESTSTVTPSCDGDQPDYDQYPVTCNAASGWCAFSDPRSVNIQAFTIGVAASGANSNGVTPLPGGSSFNALQMREYQLTLSGNLINDTGVTRTMRSNVKVRADCLRQNLAALVTGCNAAPTP